jgi:hypothetical protein
VVGSNQALEEEWEFRFWSQGGALTLLSFYRAQPGEGLAVPLSKGVFLAQLPRQLPVFVGIQPGEVTLALERGETSWDVDLETSLRNEPPPFVRTLPSARGGFSEQTYQQVLSTARGMARLMRVPRGGKARLVPEVSLEDHRVTGCEPRVLDSSGDGPLLAASEETVTLLVAALLPFTQGLGERTVQLTLEGESFHGQARARWSIVAARVLEPAAPPPEIADIHQEYRKLHEFILVEFQEQSRGYVILAAGFTLEQLAYSIVGGLLLKGSLVLVSKVAPTITSALARGGKGAVSWFRTLLARAPQQERELLRQLWMKVETQGLHALTEAEKQQLRALMGRLEQVLGTPMDDAAKRKLWAWSRQEYFERHNPQLAKLLGPEGWRNYDVHHVYPLEYAHLFPMLDINGKVNLAGVHRSVHQSISAIWKSLEPVKDRMKPQDVTRVVETIRRHYGRWFHKVYEPQEAVALASAHRAALGEVAELKVRLSP